MSSIHHKDFDLHDPDGNHLAEVPAGISRPDAWMRRLRQHLIAHDMTAGLEPEPAPVPKIRGRARRDTVDPWLAERAARIETVLGGRVRLLLREQRIAQQKFADDLGIPLSSLVDRLSGRVPFDLAEAMFIEEFFGVALEELLR